MSLKGVPPVTVAEWTLQGDGNLGFYDGTPHESYHKHVLTHHFLVSLVDGYDLPMRVDNNVECPVADCPVDLGPSCSYSSRLELQLN